jgi:hypothetical protein
MSEGTLSEFGASRVRIRLAVAGVVGGLIGFLLGEIQFSDKEGYRFFGENEEALRAGSAVWFALVLLGIGASLVASQGLGEGDNKKVLENVVRALPAIIVGGAVAGYLSQALYEGMLDENGISKIWDRCDLGRGDFSSCIESGIDNFVRPARAVGWMIAGALGGLAVGVGFRSKKRIQNGLIGGAIGGLLGGLLFDSVDNILGSTDSSSAQVPRFVALVLIGGLMGVLIGLIDTLRTEAWLTVISGEMTGRQFILYDETTLVGCARNIPITLLADREIAEHHIEIQQQDGKATFTCLRGASPVLVNGVSTSSGTISNADVLTVGKTEIQVGFRRAETGSITTPSSAPTQQAQQGGQPSFDSNAPPESRRSVRPPRSGPGRTPSPPKEGPRQRPTIQMKPKEDPS